MGKRKKSLEKLIKDLFHKNIFEGFQFTAGNTPLGIKENRPLVLTCSLNFSKQSVVIDYQAEKAVANQIINEIFGNEEYSVDLNMIKSLQKQFNEMQYEVEEADYAGYWYWFRVKCSVDEILFHVNKIKNNLKLK